MRLQFVHHFSHCFIKEHSFLNAAFGVDFRFLKSLFCGSCNDSPEPGDNESDSSVFTGKSKSIFWVGDSLIVSNVGSGDMDDSFGEVGVVFESDLITPGSSTIDDVFALDGVKFAGESVLEDESLDGVGVFIFDKIYEFGLVEDIGLGPGGGHMSVAFGGSE